MIDLIRRRRSIRQYTTEPVGRQSVDLLVETLLRAPSSRNRQPWEYIIVDDAATLLRLSLAKEHGSSFLREAPLAIVICADSEQSDVWVEDCAIAAIMVQLAAQSLGLGSCWVQIRQRQHTAHASSESYVRELLGIPASRRVAVIVGIGHPAEKREPVRGDELHYGKVRHNRYRHQWEPAVD